ncbi:MAG: chorismate synthase [Candidatus Thalassarchaeaceae archaeon]|jgi:chorismate synthase|nr:chorismate synthase [Candidatus Thalassarchaeaceae archaeon]
MGMNLGDEVRVTLFGESHGVAVGALLEGLPAGTPIDELRLISDLERRRPGRRLLSSRAELDLCEILSGVHEGKATGAPILLLVRNQDAKPRDYAFLPDHPRPGHADLPESVRTGGHADPRGGGSHSGRLTLGLVAAGALVREILIARRVDVVAHCAGIGGIKARYSQESQDSEACKLLNCNDMNAADEMLTLVHSLRKDGDTIGSTVEARIEGLELGLGEPWFDGIEPALARGLMAIPGARAVEFGRGADVVNMRGSEHNDAWGDGPKPIGDDADGALGGMATGAPLRILVHFKPPSSISIPQMTLHLPSGEMRELTIGGRHDPVLAPRAAPVVEAVCSLIIADLMTIRESST